MLLWPGIAPTRYRVTVDERRVLLRVQDLDWLPILFYGLLALTVFFAANVPPLERPCLDAERNQGEPFANLAMLCSMIASLGVGPWFTTLYRPATVSKRFPRVRRSIELIAAGEGADAPVEAVVIDGRRYDAGEVHGAQFIVTTPAIAPKRATIGLPGGKLGKPTLVAADRAYDLDGFGVADAIASALAGRKVEALPVSFDSGGMLMMASSLRTGLLAPVLVVVAMAATSKAFGCTLAAPFLWTGLTPFLIGTVEQVAVMLLGTELVARWNARDRDELADTALKAIASSREHQHAGAYRGNP